MVLSAVLLYSAGVFVAINYEVYHACGKVLLVLKEVLWNSEGPLWKCDGRLDFLRAALLPLLRIVDVEVRWFRA